MGVMPRTTLRVLALVLFVLALSGGQAYAATYDFTVSPNRPNEDTVTTFRFQGPLADVDRIDWDLDNDGDFDDGQGTQPRTVVTRTYANPGPVTVRMRVREDDGDRITTTKTIVVNATPSADFDFAPASPMTGQEIEFTEQVSDPDGDDLTLSWTFDDGETATGSSPTHAYADAGTYDVVLKATDEHGAVASKTVAVTVREDPGPTAGFTYEPAAPLTDETVTFTSTSTPSYGSITALDWDLDGDGEFDDAQGPTATWSYASAGSHLVLLRVEQANGRRSVAFTHVEVAERPPPEPPSPEPTPPADGQPTFTEPIGGTAETFIPVTPQPTTRRLARMRPFPVVRIAGVVLPYGAAVKVLSVRAPRGAQVRVRCRGRGCPVGSVARTSATGLLRFERFERRLRAGIALELFIRKPGTIGKYTRFLIRAGKAPARVDRCLTPGRARPVRCS